MCVSSLADTALEFLYHASFEETNEVAAVVRRAMRGANQHLSQQEQRFCGTDMPSRLLRAAVEAGLAEAAVVTAQELRLVVALLPAL